MTRPELIENMISKELSLCHRILPRTRYWDLWTGLIREGNNNNNRGAAPWESTCCVVQTHGRQSGNKAKTT